MGVDDDIGLHPGLGEGHVLHPPLLRADTCGMGFAGEEQNSSEGVMRRREDNSRAIKSGELELAMWTLRRPDGTKLDFQGTQLGDVLVFGTQHEYVTHRGIVVGCASGTRRTAQRKKQRTRT